MLVFSILFDAVSKSLVGTEGQTMIDRLYGGTVATCTLCSECGYKSERLEVINDVSVHVHG